MTDGPTTRRPWGVNVAGYLGTDLGIGEAARLLIAALDAHDVPVAPVRYRSTHSAEGDFGAMSTDDYPFGITIACVNADGFPQFAAGVSEDVRTYRYTIGLWFWELGSFPDDFAAAFEHLDEVWVASRFVADAVGAKATVPVTRVPLPVRTAAAAVPSRAALGLPEGFAYLFVFDHNSVFERKNPLAVVEAFDRAHPEPGEASLVVKSVNGEHDPEHAATLTAACAARPDIHLVDRHLPGREIRAMVASCDAYVSLHRSEGFGLTMAEAMAAGRPVIATGYSGNLDFMTGENAFLVPYAMADVGPGNEPYAPDATWAQPDVEHAAALMRGVFEDREAAAAVAARGRADIERTHSADAAGAAMLERLREVEDRIPERPGHGQFADAVFESARGTERARRVVTSVSDRPPAAGAKGKAADVVLRAAGPIARASRQADEEVLAAIDELIATTASGMQWLRDLQNDSEAALLAGLRRVEERQAGAEADLRGELARIARRVDELDARLRGLER